MFSVHPPPIGEQRKLSPAHLTELSASGISGDAARAAGVFSTDDQTELARLLGRKACRLGDSLVYPFVDAAGRPTNHVRVKPGAPSADPTNGKPKKYLAPTGQPSRLYIPPNSRAALSDPAIPLVLTEGCKQALACDGHGFPCVAVTGVWNGFKKREKRADGKPAGPRELIDDLTQIEFTGRVVFLTFDSDAATNPKVAAALRATATALDARGAVVKLVRLPGTPDGGKQGVDDFLAARGPDAFRLLLELATPFDPKHGGPGEAEPEKKPSAAERAAGIAFQKCDLWHDPTGDGFASIGRLSLPVRSSAFRQWLTNEFRRESGGRVPNGEAVATAVTAVDAAAVYEGPERVAHVRVAGAGGRVYVALADTAHTVIEIGPDGWRECPDPPVKFRLARTARPLPRPTRGGTLAPLRALLNITDDDQFALLVGWLMSVYLPDGPFPLLVLSGSQGAAKTTTAKVLKALADPSAIQTRCQPKEVGDLHIAASGNRVLVFDNLSGVPDWFSDALCTMATGGGAGRRALYTDAEETVFDSKRPVVLTSITDVLAHGDVVERAVVLRLPAIPDDRRRTESEFWVEFDRHRPALLGAVFDRVAAGLRAQSSVRLTRLPRMADFCRWAVGCERGMGEPERFLAAYQRNQQAAQEMPLEDSAVTAPLLALMDGRAGWSGTPSDLLDALTRHARDPKAREWPKKPNALTAKLRRLAPNLRSVCELEIDLDGRSPDRNRSRVITVRHLPGMSRDPSSAPPTPAGVGDLPTKTPVRPDGETQPESFAPPPAPSARPPADGSRAVGGRWGGGRSSDQLPTNLGEADGADGADGADDGSAQSAGSHARDGPGTTHPASAVAELPQPTPEPEPTPGGGGRGAGTTLGGDRNGNGQAAQNGSAEGVAPAAMATDRPPTVWEDFHRFYALMASRGWTWPQVLQWLNAPPAAGFYMILSGQRRRAALFLEQLPTSQPRAEGSPELDTRGDVFTRGRHVG